MLLPVNWGRDVAKMTIFNAHNQPVTEVINFETNIDDNELDEKIYLNAKRLTEEHGINEKRIYGIGITMPGLIDEINGINHTIKNKEVRNVREKSLKPGSETCLY